MGLSVRQRESLERHKKWLQRKKGGAQIVFEGKNFAGARLRKVDLRRAVIRFSNFTDADLTGARLARTLLYGNNFTRTWLWEADLSDANLSSTNLKGANLQGANLTNSILCDANLLSASLTGATITNAFLPPPSMILLANWTYDCYLSDELTLELMRYDCANHPWGKEAFDAWAKGGGCPYTDCQFQHAALFNQNRHLWKYGPPKSALELAEMLLQEKCIGYKRTCN